LKIHWDCGQGRAVQISKLCLAMARSRENFPEPAICRAPSHRAGQIIDELDNHLGPMIGGSRLAGEEKCRRGALYHFESVN